MSISNPPGILAAPPAIRRSIASAAIGNFMEFFDFGAYGFLAATIGLVFFPNSDPTVQLLSSLAAFAVAFFFRPIGGAMFGFIGDRYGRRTALVLAIVVMSLATALIGVLPGFQAIGIWAPVLLVVLRSIQGLSVGGEFAGASTFIIEYSPSNQRGRWSSLVSSTSALGTLIGSGTVLLLTSTLTTDEMTQWGWRIPFLAALPIGLIGLYMRLRLEDTPVYNAMMAANGQKHNPFKSLRKQDLRAILVVFVICGAGGLGFYYFATYINTYLSSSLGYDRTTAITLTLIGVAFYGAICPLAGMLSDRFGRKRTFVIGCAIFIVVIFPVFLLLGTGFVGALIGMFIYAVPQAMVNVNASLVLVESFPARTRLTGGAIGNNLSNAIISGTGPFIAAALVAGTGNALAPAYYFAAVLIVIGVLSVFILRDTSRRRLFDGAADEVGADSVTTGS